MMKELVNPTTRMLRQFAGLWIVFFAGAALLQEFHRERHTVALILGVLAVTIGPMGLIKPAAIKPIFIGWMVAVYPIGWTISRIILSALFYLLFTPIGWVLRLKGRDELRLKPAPGASTYWREKPQAVDSSQYLRQF